MIEAVDDADSTWEWNKLWNACKAVDGFDFQERTSGKFKITGDHSLTHGEIFCRADRNCEAREQHLT